MGTLLDLQDFVAIMENDDYVNTTTGDLQDFFAKMSRIQPRLREMISYTTVGNVRNFATITMFM